MKEFSISFSLSVFLFLCIFIGLVRGQPIQSGTSLQRYAENTSINSEQGEHRQLPIERFKAGEALIINIYADTSSILNGGYSVDPEGYVDLPILGKIFVIDKTRMELESYLANKMSNYMKDTNVSARPAIRISFLGNFQQPGMQYIHPDEILWDAFLQAYGPADERNLKKLHVMRGAKELTLKPLEAFSGGLTLREAGIKSGDIFVIPTPLERKGFWYYFKETIQITGSIAATTISVLTAIIILEGGYYIGGRR